MWTCHPFVIRRPNTIQHKRVDYIFWLGSFSDTFPISVLPITPRWESITLAPEIDVQWIIVHGTHDEVIPFASAVKLVRAARNGHLVIVRQKARDSKSERKQTQ
jgi:hypothetical protein